MSDSSIKQCIHNALLELMKTKSLDCITVKELAVESNIARATFYRYYDNIDAVIEDIEDQFLEELRDNSRYYLSMDFDINNLEASVPNILGIVRTMKKYRNFILAVSSINGDARFALRAQNFFVEFYAGKLAYEGIAKTNLDVYKTYAMGGQFAVIKYFLEKRQDIPDEEIALIMLKLLYAPFFI